MNAQEEHEWRCSVAKSLGDYESRQHILHQEHVRRAVEDTNAGWAATLFFGFHALIALWALASLLDVMMGF